MLPAVGRVRESWITKSGCVIESLRVHVMPLCFRTSEATKKRQAAERLPGFQLPGGAEAGVQIFIVGLAQPCILPWVLLVIVALARSGYVCFVNTFVRRLDELLVVQRAQQALAGECNDSSTSPRRSRISGGCSTTDGIKKFFVTHSNGFQRERLT